ncbi:hypothetical protein [Desulfuromonas sp.]|uniref:hypothetical protein n=1 Tax=Desulfuromonas sp. TaxID=892 RepID=UPI0025C6223B|nr:hypothetical protein [Desulfuromonas sp.]
MDDPTIEYAHEFSALVDAGNLVFQPFENNGEIIGPTVLSSGGGLFLLEFRAERGIVKCYADWPRRVLALSGGPFPGGDPVHKVVRKFFYLQDFLRQNLRDEVHIQGSLVFPDCYVDFHHSKKFSPLNVNVIRLKFLSDYLKRKDQTRDKWKHLSAESCEELRILLESLP